MKKQNVILIGLMGSGKTTIGQYIAHRLNLMFYDSDAVIAQRTGAAINWIFDLEGEEGFRDREQKVIEELCALNHVVLATGGGAVIRPANRQQLRENGAVIYLRTNVEQLLLRTEKSQHRPLLNNHDRKATYAKLLAERDPLYMETAHVMYDTDNYRVAALGDIIVNELTQHGGF